MKKKMILFIIISFMVGYLAGQHKINDNYLDMTKVVEWDDTSTGLMLYTNDGSGYYFEKNINVMK